MTQPDLFADLEAESRHAEAVRRNWGTRQPSVGTWVYTCAITGTREDGTMLYCYGEPIRLVEHRPDGAWIGVIDLGLVDGKPWSKNGTRLVLGMADMFPDRHR